MLTAERLREVLNYDPETGVFTWRISVAKRSKAGSVAGRSRGGGRRYSSISVDKIRYASHRLAWLHYYGDWPASYIDHIDCDGFNNSIDNLRLANRSQNGANTKNNTNKKLPKGVSVMGVRYRARISRNGKVYYLGVYDTPERASAAYANAAVRLFGEFARA